MNLDVQKIDKFAHGGKVIALCLPPVVTPLIGLAALSPKKRGTIVAGRKTSPGVRSKRVLRGSL